MKLKILEKQYKGNCDHKTNIITFKINDKEFDIDIVYLDLGENNKFNCFVESSLYNTLYNYVCNNFNITWGEFQDYFLYKLYKYSKGRNLTKSKINMNSKFIKKMESI